MYGMVIMRGTEGVLMGSPAGGGSGLFNPLNTVINANWDAGKGRGLPLSCPSQPQ